MMPHSKGVRDPSTFRRFQFGRSWPRLLLLTPLLFALLIAAYGLGSFTARDVITRPDKDWSDGSNTSGEFIDLISSVEFAAAEYRKSNPGADEATLSLAFDYLTQLLSASIEMSVAKGDPSKPQFTDWMSDYRKFLGDSPDAIYLTAPVNASFDYDVIIEPANADYIGVVIYDKHPITGWNRVADHYSAVTSTDKTLINLTLTSNMASAIQNGKSARVLELTDTAHTIMVRRYFFNDRSGEKRDLSTIADTAISRAPASHTSMTQSDSKPLDFSKKLDNATSFFNQTWQGTVALAAATSDTANTFDRPATVTPDFVGVFYPTPDNDYHGGAFKLMPGESLVVEGNIPEAAFWSITLQNHWMQSLEPAIGTGSLRGDQITNRDGRYRVWISDTPPTDGEDWLNTAGETEGLVAIRYLMAEATDQPSAKLVQPSGEQSEE